MKPPASLALAFLVPLALAPTARGQCHEWRDMVEPTAPPMMPSIVTHLQVFDDGSGPALYVTGNFDSVGAVGASGIARWDGAQWSSVGEGDPEQAAGAMAVFDDGSGPALYCGGGPMSVSRWDGTDWTTVGDWDVTTTVSPYDMIVYDDGTGPALYVAGGSFGSVLARLDGTSWTVVGHVGGGDIDALHVHDDGNGPAIFAAGDFTGAGGTLPTRHIARWDPTNGWSVMGSGPGFATGTNGRVRDLATFDDGSGPKLYVCGAFTQAGGFSAPYLARWDGTGWSGVFDGPDTQVRTLFVHDDGRGPALYAGGRFETIDGAAIPRMARFDGSTWSALAESVDFRVIAMETFDDRGPGGPALYVAGDQIGGIPSAERIARWGACALPTFCDGIGGVLAACPCGNPGRPDTGCDLAQGTGGVELYLHTQETSPQNRMTLAASGFPAGASTPGVVIRGPSTSAAQVFGDGLLCAALPVVRLGVSTASGGTSEHAFGHGAGAGTFAYQLWFRNTPISYCDPGAAFNLSNGVLASWP